ncbi:MAG TPA: hypothetical protein VG735_15405 [Caulobacterales bacterium]|nr:hypothetical protein [Caulobacterales bacterium]
MTALSLTPNQKALLLCMAVAAAACIQPVAGLAHSYGDADDATRLVEVRALLHGRGWFDLVEPRFAPPLGLDVHWSRLVDAPIALLLGVFSFLFGSPAGEILTRAIWPVAVFAPAAFCWIRIAGRLGGTAAMWAAAAMAPLCGSMFQEFEPGRLDHHNVQIALVAGLMLASLDAQRPRAAALMGALCGISLAIGFETAPVIVWAAGLIALRFAWSKDNAPAAVAFGLALAVSTGAAFLVQTPPSWWLRTGCDALAFNGLAGATTSGLVLAGFAYRSSDSRLTRFGAAVIAGCVGVAALIALHPSCLHGPYADMDPRINAVWLSRVSEARSFFHLLADQPLMGVTIAAIPLAALWLSIARLRKNPDVGLLALTVLLAMTCAVSLVQVRGIAVATAAAIPLAAAGLTRLPQLNRLSPLLAGLAIGVLANSTMLGAFLGALAPANVMAHEQHGAANSEACLTNEAFADLRRLPAGVVMADLDAGPHILAQTVHSAVAGPYHRIGAEIFDSMTIFAGSPGAAETIIARDHADYVAFCRSGVFAAEAKPGSFGFGLLHGGHPAWLAPIEGRQGAYALFKVNKSALAAIS